MKVVRTKLNRGLSVSTTEEHLRSMAALLGDKSIPTHGMKSSALWNHLATQTLNTTRCVSLKAIRT